ncbi:MAG: type II toxin-antitoxin system VapC family toxin [Moraxella sp.]|nr:type II toxin-antitoxin system VapC family toxin [Moraxella sp.]
MILVDSNIIIYHFNGMSKATEFLNAHQRKLYLSAMSVAEVLSFAPSEKALGMAEQFLNENFIWLDISREIILTTAKIRRQRKIKMPDAIIGATALVHHLAIASRNEKGFKYLAIDIINPIDS